jgi:acetyl-CoA decarbonylase/synthase complex subunit gamma
LVPWLLPWLPFRAFALKGAVAGALVAAGLLRWLPGGAIEGAGAALLVMAITSYMAMTFTGSTTFTTLAGVRLEVRWGLPPILIAAGAGAILRVAGAL